MTIDDITLYLGDNTELANDLIASLAEEIFERLDYSCMYDQIDTLVGLLTSAPAPAGE
tara:strand:- start:105 stop:278 length:174 start_codon:yes stop_codon:yes gene_type:complete